MPETCSAPSSISRRLAPWRVAGIDGVGLAKRRDRRVVLAELLADVTEGEPGRDEIRRPFDRLPQQVGGGDQIALQLQIAREIEAAVGHRIAGRQEQSRGHGLYVTGKNQSRASYI